MSGLIGFLLLLGGIGDATAPTGLISGSVCATSGPIAGIPDVAAANGATSPPTIRPPPCRPFYGASPPPTRNCPPPSSIG